MQTFGRVMGSVRPPNLCLFLNYLLHFTPSTNKQNVLQEMPIVGRNVKDRTGKNFKRKQHQGDISKFASNQRELQLKNMFDSPLCLQGVYSLIKYVNFDSKMLQHSTATTFFCFISPGTVQKAGFVCISAVQQDFFSESIMVYSRTIIIPIHIHFLK